MTGTSKNPKPQVEICGCWFRGMLLPMAESPNQKEPAQGVGEPPPVQHVEEDVLCVSCSYNLRGLPVTGRCPECGATVERALRGDTLYFASGAYLGKLVNGATIVFWGTIGKIAATIITLGVLILLGYTTSVELISQFISLAFALVIAFGWWLFSEPDPSILNENTGWRSRRFVRISTVVAAAGSLLAFAAVFLTYFEPSAGEATSTAGNTFEMFASIVLYFASLLYIAWLMSRVPDDVKLKEHARRLMWLGPLVYILGACVVVGPLIALVLYLILIYRVREKLQVILAAQPREYAQPA